MGEWLANPASYPEFLINSWMFLRISVDEFGQSSETQRLKLILFLVN